MTFTSVISPVVRLKGNIHKVKNLKLGEPKLAYQQECLRFLVDKGVSVNIHVHQINDSASVSVPHFHNIYKSQKGIVQYRRFLFPGATAIIRMEDIEGTNPTIECNPVYYWWSNMRVSRLFTLADHVESIVTIKLLQKSMVLLHGGIVAKNGSAILLTGLPNVGKTTNVLRLIKEGYHFLSEDVSIVDNTGMAFAVPFTRSFKTQGFGKWLRRMGRLIFKDIKFGHSSALELSSEIPVRESARLERIYILEKDADIKLSLMHPKLALKKLLGFNRMEFNYCRNTSLLTYLLFHSNRLINDYTTLEINTIWKLVNRCEVFSVGCAEHFDVTNIIMADFK